MLVHAGSAVNIDSYKDVEAYWWEMIEMHKKQMEFWKSKLGISDYTEKSYVYPA